MRVVHKYEIKASGYSLIKLNQWDNILDAMVIEDKLFIWVERHPNIHKEIIERIFFLVNTGDAWDPIVINEQTVKISHTSSIKMAELIPDEYNTYLHIRTVRFSNGTIQHLYEARDKRES